METKYELHSKKFYDQDEFLKEIKTQSENTTWETGDLNKDIKFIVNVDDNGLTVQTQKSLNSPNSDRYRVAPWAFNSLRTRLGLNGAPIAMKGAEKALEVHTTAEDIAQLLKYSAKICDDLGMPTKVKLPVLNTNDGELPVVNAFLTNTYVEHLNSNEVYNIVLEELTYQTGILDFDFRGFVDETMSQAEFKVSEDYEDFKEGTTFKVRTSDIGMSSIGLAYGKQVKNNRTGRNVYVPMMSDENLPHRASIKMTPAEVKKDFALKFREKLTRLVAVLKESEVIQDNLDNIQITNYLGSFLNIAKSIGLPKTEFMSYARELKNSIPTNPTAWDLYLDLADVVELGATTGKWDLQKIALHQANLSKICAFKESTFKSFDKQSELQNQLGY